MVAANRLAPVLVAGAPPDAIDEAARRVEAERLAEVVEIQRLQQIPPRVMFGHSRWRQALFGALFPLLVRSGIAGWAFSRVFTRFARGVTDVRLEVSV